MTNEELALQVQAGNGAAFDELTRQNRGMIHRCAMKLYATVGGDRNPLGAEYDDMVQIAPLGLYGACMAYDPEKGFKLLSYLWRQMMGVFRDQYRPYRNDVMKEALCGDEINPDGGEGYTLLDSMPDEQAQRALDDVEGAIYQQQSRAALERALDELPQERTANAIRQNYFEGQGLKAVGKQLGVSTERARQIIQRGIATLCQSKQLDEYRALYAQEYTEAKAYRGTCNSTLYVLNYVRHFPFQ